MAESTLQGLIGEIKEFLEWIKDTLEDDEARKSLLEDVGLEPTDPPPKPNVPQDKLDSIGRYQQTVDADKAALDSTLSDLRAVFDSVRSFISSFSLSPALVGEVTNRFLNLLALNYIRLRKPQLFVAAQAVSFVEDTGAPFLSGKITWKNIVKVCTDGGFYLLRTILIALDDEEEAQERSDFYFVPLAAFLAFAFKQNNRSLYGWDPAPESGTPQGDAISRRMLSSVFFTTERDSNGQTVEKRINASLYFLSTPQGGPGLFLTLGGGGALEAPLSERWKALLEVSSPSVVDMTFFGEKIFTIRGPLGGPPDIRASAGLQSIPDQTNRSFVLPSDSDTHFEIGTVELVATVNANAIDLDATRGRDQAVAQRMRGGHRDERQRRLFVVDPSGRRIAVSVQLRPRRQHKARPVHRGERAVPFRKIDAGAWIDASRTVERQASPDRRRHRQGLQRFDPGRSSARAGRAALAAAQARGERHHSRHLRYRRRGERFADPPARSRLHQHRPARLRAEAGVPGERASATSASPICRSGQRCRVASPFPSSRALSQAAASFFSTSSAGFTRARCS